MPEWSWRACAELCRGTEWAIIFCTRMILYLTNYYICHAWCRQSNASFHLIGAKLRGPDTLCSTPTALVSKHAPFSFPTSLWRMPCTGWYNVPLCLAMCFFSPCCCPVVYFRNLERMSGKTCESEALTCCVLSLCCCMNNCEFLWFKAWPHCLSYAHVTLRGLCPQHKMTPGLIWLAFFE